MIPPKSWEKSKIQWNQFCHECSNIIIFCFFQFLWSTWKNLTWFVPRLIIRPFSSFFTQMIQPWVGNWQPNSTKPFFLCLLDFARVSENFHSCPFWIWFPDLLCLFSAIFAFKCQLQSLAAVLITRDGVWGFRTKDSPDKETPEEATEQTGQTF